MTAEEWRVVAGYERYQVSDTGRVVSYARRQPSELRGGLAGKGHPLYRIVMLYGADGQFVRRKVHVLVCEAFHGPRPEGMVVRHLDGDTMNNSAANLAWGTQSTNVLDQVDHGVHPQARKTHCPSGHAYSPENTLRSSGRRTCRTCHRQHAANSKIRRALRAAAVRSDAAA